MDRKKLINAANRVPQKAGVCWFERLLVSDPNRAAEVNEFALEYVNGGELASVFLSMKALHSAMIHCGMIPASVQHRPFTDWVQRVRDEQSESQNAIKKGSHRANGKAKSRS